MEVPYGTQLNQNMAPLTFSNRHLKVQVIAGGAMRAVLVSWCKCTSKCYGSTNPVNVVRAVNALKEMESPEDVAMRRGKKTEDL